MRGFTPAAGRRLACFVGASAHAFSLPSTGAAVSIRRKCKVATLAIKATELGVAAPLVVAHRLTRMALAGRTPKRLSRTCVR
jgi:hypothetical protein